MSLFQFSPDPPAHWAQHCAEHRALFHTSAWQRVIEAAFGSVSIYGWHAAARIGLAISEFRAGPFRIGYLGFPVGGVLAQYRLNPTPLMSGVPPTSPFAWTACAFR